MVSRTVTTVWCTELGTTLLIGFANTTEIPAYFHCLNFLQCPPADRLMPSSSPIGPATGPPAPNQVRKSLVGAPPRPRINVLLLITVSGVIPPVIAPPLDPPVFRRPPSHRESCRRKSVRSPVPLRRMAPSCRSASLPSDQGRGCKSARDRSGKRSASGEFMFCLFSGRISQGPCRTSASCARDSLHFRSFRTDLYVY